MDEHPFAIAMRPRQRAQKVPPAVNRAPFALWVFQLVARPEDRSLGARVESFGVEQSALIVVAQQAHAGLLDHQVQALARIWPVANDVAQAEDFFCPLLANIG